MNGELVSAYEQVTRARLEALEQRFEEHEKLQSEQFKEIKDDLKAIRQELNNRLPLWVTILFTIGGGVLGAFISTIFGR